MKIHGHIYTQQSLFAGPSTHPRLSRFITTYRVALVKDGDLPFEKCRLSSSQQAQPILKNLVHTYGQSDREQFCIILLNTKNEITGLNIVSTGSVSSAPVCPREVLKPAILANASALILAHNHPSGDPRPSPEDLAVTEKLVQACHLVGIQVHEHLILSMFDDNYYSMADHGVIAGMYDNLRDR